MNMMSQVAVEGKPNALRSGFQALQEYVVEAARSGAAAHEVEAHLFRELLTPGYQLQGQFFELLGDGDQGPSLERVGWGDEGTPT